MAGPSLPDRVAQFYYSHGLFCSSHPFLAIFIAITSFIICNYPLLNLPIPGSIPIKANLPYNHQDGQKSFNGGLYSFMQSNTSENVNKLHTENQTQDVNSSQPNISVSLTGLMNEIVNLPFHWAKDPPLLYVQQIVLKTGVWPWGDDLKLCDAFRAPLLEVFRLLETVRNHQHPETSTSLGHICFHVENIKRNHAAMAPIFPEYSCLVLSPANLWQQNIEKFLLDSNILNTVFNHQNIQKGKVSVAEMAFGMHLKDTGIKRYPFRARPRALQYAITLFLHELNDRYIESLKEKLLSVYPLHHKWDKGQTTNQITLIYYPGEFNYYEFVPLCMTFIGLFVYVYFSVRKLEFVKSKLGLSVAAVASVAASLMMTIGFCFFFGLTLSFQGKELFPYLVILFGTENIFVLTKSVTSIDHKLDVKIRLAQGLSKEGWSITKNLLVEITILTVGLFTFVPVIQQLSIFTIVSLLTDFFLQMIFFTTVLGIDIKRKEETREKSNEFQLNQRISPNLLKIYIHDFSGIPKNNMESSSLYSGPSKIMRSKSHPKLNTLTPQPHTNVVATPYHYFQSTGKTDKKVPKRIRLVNIWARTRFFQRAFMIWMVVWISMIIYNSGIFENIFDLADTSGQDDKINKHNKKLRDDKIFPLNTSDVNYNNHMKPSLVEELKMSEANYSLPISHDSAVKSPNNLNKETVITKADMENIAFNSEILNKTLHFISLKHLSYPQPWLRLSEFHWCTVLAQYNVSLSGRYLAVLPPILVKHRVTPEKAAATRNPSEKDNFTPPSRWRALVAALDPLDLTDFEIEDGIQIPHLQFSQSPNDIPYYPTSPMEILLLAILCCISVLVIAYAMVVLYRCVCTKNYAEWRSSWTKLDKDKQLKRPALQFVMEAIPTVVSGHNHEIECLASNGEYIVSCCLQGQLKIWDPANGELVQNIDRHAFFGLRNNMYDQTNKFEIGSSDDSDTSMDENGYKKSLRKRHLSKHLRSEYDQVNKKNADLENIIKSHSNQDQTESFPRLINQKVMNNIRDSDDAYKLTNSSNIKNAASKDSPGSNQIDNNHLQSSDHNHPIISNKIGNVSPDIGSALEGDDLYLSKLSPKIINAVINYMDSSEKLEPNSCKNFAKSAMLDLIECSEFPPSIWCMDFADGIIVLGCSDGRLEFWDAITGKFKCKYDDKNGSSVSFVRIVMEGMSSCGMHLIAARLSGHLDLMLLEATPPAQSISKRTHIRTGSAGSILLRDESFNYSRQDYEQSPQLSYKSSPKFRDPSLFNLNLGEDLGERLQCRRLAVIRAHQQPITGLEYDGGKILTGSQDHTLKVFSSYDLSALYTLHGHWGPITCLFIDRFCPTVSGSGSEDGLLCVWDLITGTCVYSIQAHDGSITQLTYTESYVISMGVDERLCIWDRFRGHLLNSTFVGQGAGTCGILTLTHTLIITGGRGGLTVWDASTGEAVRKVQLGTDGCIFVRKILPLKDAIVCDYANELRIVRFPLFTEIEDEFERKND